MGLIINSGSCNLDALAKIRATTNVDLNWLVCGDGKLNVNSLKVNESEAIAARTRRKTPAAGKKPRAKPVAASTNPPPPLPSTPASGKHRTSGR